MTRFTIPIGLKKLIPTEGSRYCPDVVDVRPEPDKEKSALVTVTDGGRSGADPGRRSPIMIDRLGPAEEHKKHFRSVHNVTEADSPLEPDGPTVCKKCGGTEFVCRENVPQEWPMASNKGGVSIVFETGGGAELDYDACHGAAVYCANCGAEEPDVGIDFSDDSGD